MLSQETVMDLFDRSNRIFRMPALALTLVVLFAAAVMPSQAQTVNTIYTFASNNNTGPIMPFGTMAQGRDGAFYGISQSGNGCCQGWFYKITAGGTLTPLHALTTSEGTNCNGLTLDTDGNFYGTCYAGGSASFGTLFKVTPTGTLTVLHNFTGVNDGCSPISSPIQGTDGNIYGTSYFCGGTDLGSVYKYTPAGVYSILYNFKGAPTDLQGPHGLLQGSDGNFWGMGDQGGAQNSACPGCGGVFKITPAGKETIVYTFKGGADGQDPYTSLMQGSDGNYYGTTIGAGGSFLGTVFKLTPKGVETVLHNYSDQSQGAFPRLPLTQGPDGTLFGMATDCAGGGCSQAALFDITANNVYSTLYLYPLGPSNSLQPSSPLLLSTNGTLYGTTEQGGAKTVGTFYSVSNKYSPFISLVNVNSGKEGVKVGILGQGFTSSSVVKFGGTAASTVQRTGSTFILATVPSGALTGKVTVTTGTTTLSTPSIYKVTPTFSSFSPASGPVGTSVTISGTGLAQTTKVTFNKVSATFTVNSDSKITATVPTGATSGKIAVTTKGGSVTDATSFTVN